ncbi:cyclin-domain-containing protein, partial [Gorgonomyces haynaldii]
NTMLSKTVLTPASLSPTLPLFVATLVYSMWHGTSFTQATLQPSAGLQYFTKFTANILKTTSLPFSVVILALKYIHRIKSRRPDLKGAEGSECRLLLCALMLSMKYLVDNTYSNKTWHKVSKIPLQEINITEIEFMGQLGYDLHVSEEEYFVWIQDVDEAVTKFRSLTRSESQEHV